MLGDLKIMAVSYIASFAYTRYGFKTAQFDFYVLTKLSAILKFNGAHYTPISDQTLIY